MNGLIQRQSLVIWILDLDWTVFHTDAAPCAFLLFNVPGLLDQGDVELPCFSLHPLHFRIGENLNIGMPADLDQFGRKDSDGAVVGGKGLIKLSHLAANGRGLIDQIDLKPRRGQVKRRLNAADPSANHHHISNATFSRTFANTVCKALIELLNFFIFHFLYPHSILIGSGLRIYLKLLY